MPLLELRWGSNGDRVCFSFPFLLFTCFGYKVKGSSHIYDCFINNTSQDNYYYTRRSTKCFMVAVISTFLDTEVSTIYLILLFSFFLRGQIIYTHILGFQI